MPVLDDVVQDPQMRAANAIVAFDHPARGAIETVNSPVFVSGTRKRPPSAAPEVGQHTREVLEELGYRGPELEALLRAGGTS
jgi:formyl-CoA transferase